jgi:phytoene desaturase
MPLKTAVVVGAGIGGLASGIRLAAKGYGTTIVEQGPKTGGKISEFFENGFRFDRGPSLLTLPNLIDELFILCKENPSEYFKYERLEKSCKYYWDDGCVINAWSDQEKFLEEVRSQTGENPDRVIKFFKKSKQLYDLTAESFLFNSLHKAENFKSREFLNTLMNSWRLDPFISMHDRNSRWFKNKRIIQLFDRFATYNGSNPFKTPATLNIIAHLEHTLGAFFPAGGMYEIAASLTGLAERQGVKLMMNTKVMKVVSDNGIVKGIGTDDSYLPADIIVSNIDVNLLYRDLITSGGMPPSLIKDQRSTSALIFFWGIGTITQFELHNVLFSGNYKDEFTHLFDKKEFPSDPTVYIYISSKVVTTDAPPGSENWYVMINAPENSDRITAESIAKARENIISRINRVLGNDIESFILFEKILDPAAIEKETGSYKGSLYGLSSNSMFSAFNRHPNFSKKYKNLYFTGGSVHPGGGIPLSLASAKIIDKEIKPLETSL